MTPLAYSNIPCVITEDIGGTPARYTYIGHVTFELCRPQWPRGLRSGSAVAPWLRFWIRIPPGAWSSVSCECCELSGQITHPEDFYRVWFVWVLSWILYNKEALPQWGLLRRGKKKNHSKSSIQLLTQKQFSKDMLRTDRGLFLRTVSLSVTGMESSVVYYDVHMDTEGFMRHVL